MEGAGGAGGAGGGSEACASRLDPAEGESLLLALPAAALAPGEERTLCPRHTLKETLDVTALVGTIGQTGHHALLLAHQTPSAPDGIAPCSEPEIMDAATLGDFQMLAGVSYESDGVRYAFPEAPVQVGLRIPAGSQLILDAHFLNPGTESRDGCATLELERSAPVVAALEFRTVLPEEQYGLVVPAHKEISVSYEEPAGKRFRVAAASSHMHEGGKHFRMYVVETGQTIYESTEWAEPQPETFENEKLVVDKEQTLRIECTFENHTGADQHFPDQMCVGGMYVLPCIYPGAC